MSDPASFEGFLKDVHEVASQAYQDWKQNPDPALLNVCMRLLKGHQDLVASAWLEAATPDPDAPHDAFWDAVFQVRYGQTYEEAHQEIADRQEDRP